MMPNKENSKYINTIYIYVCMWLYVYNNIKLLKIEIKYKL